MSTEQVETKPCEMCGEPTGPIPEDLIGVYETPDGEEYAAYHDQYLHPDCCERQIERIRNGQRSVADYTGAEESDNA